MIPIPINNIPTPKRKAFLHPDSFPENASAILAPPPKRSAMPRKTVIIHVANPGNAITRPANISTSIPRPIEAPLPLIGRKIPAIIFSIPIISKTMPRINTIETNAAPGYARA